MTVGELMQLLNTYPENTPVVLGKRDTPVVRLIWKGKELVVRIESEEMADGR